MRNVSTLIALAILVAGCIGGQASPGGPQGGSPNLPTEPVAADQARILGTITDDALVPLAGVQVGLIGTSPLISAVTNEAGKYVLDALVPGHYSIGVQKLGYQTAGRAVDLSGGQSLEANFVLPALPVSGPAYHTTIIGEGYFACGADTPVVTWGNLYACVWTTHKPNVSFEAPKADLKGIMQELVWTQNSALTSQSLSVSLKYKQVCNPFCSEAANFHEVAGPSPVRMYTDAKSVIEKVKEDPMSLLSVTFPNRAGQPFVVVYQQRMTHYITLFFGEEASLEAYSALPDK